MKNEYLLNLENKFHGIHTRLKELHFSAPSKNIHEMIDEFDSKFQAFDDEIMEDAQSIFGFIGVGEINPQLPEATDFESLLLDMRGLLVGLKKEAGDQLMWTGIINEVDDFFHVVNKTIYLLRIAKHEATKGEK